MFQLYYLTHPFWQSEIWVNPVPFPLNNSSAQCIFSFILPDVQHEKPLSCCPHLPVFSSFSFISPLSTRQGAVRCGAGWGGWVRRMRLVLNESCSLSKTTFSGQGRQGEEVNALCQRWQAAEPRAINSERERHFLLINAILNYYYFIW